MRGIRTVLRPSLGAICVFAVAFILTFAPTLALLRQPYTTWSAFDSIWGTIPGLLLPGLAALSAATALRRGGAGSMIMLPVGKVPVFVRLAVLQSPLVIAAVGGVLVGVVPLLIRTIGTATAGSPDLASIPLFFGHMLVFIAAGTALAAAVKSFLAVPIAVVAGFVWTQATNFYGDSFYMVAPFRPYPQEPGQSLSDPVVIGSGLFIVAALALLVVGCWALTTSPPKRATASAALALAAVLGAGIVTVADKAEVAPLAVDSNAPRECRDSERVSVCVHQAHAPDLAQIADGAESVLLNYGESLPSRPVLIDRSLLMAPRELSPDVVVFSIRPGQTDSVRVHLAQQLSGFWACAHTTDPAGNEAAARLQDWLINGPTTQDPNQTRSTMWEFIRTNQKAISECRADPASLPPL